MTINLLPTPSVANDAECAMLNLEYSLVNIIQGIKEDSECKNLVFDSLDLIYSSEFAQIIDQAKAEAPNSNDIWKATAVKKLKTLHRFAYLDEKQTEQTRVFFEKMLNADMLEGNRLPNLVLVAPSKISSGCSRLTIIASRGLRSRTITLRELQEFHRLLPHLKSIRLNTMNIDTSVINESFVENEVERIDILLNSAPKDSYALVQHLLKSYHTHLKDFKIAILDTSKNPAKWEKAIHNQNNMQQEQESITLEHLKNFEVNYFYEHLQVSRVVNLLKASQCQLKHASFLGLYDNEPVVAALTENMKDSLESLTLSTHGCPTLANFKKLQKLNRLSILWTNTTNKVNVAHVANLLPNVEHLELGYTCNYDKIESDSQPQLTATTPSRLHSLSLHGITFVGHEFEQLHTYVPALHNLALTNCKFGQTKNSSSELLLLKKYHLQTLTLDNCSLYYSKKDSSQGRFIHKFDIDFYNNTIEVVKRVGYNTAKQERVSTLDNAASYICVNDSFIPESQLPTLCIRIGSLELLQLDPLKMNALQFTLKPSNNIKQDEEKDKREQALLKSVNKKSNNSVEKKKDMKKNKKANMMDDTHDTLVVQISKESNPTLLSKRKRAKAEDKSRKKQNVSLDKPVNNKDPAPKKTSRKSTTTTQEGISATRGSRRANNITNYYAIPANWEEQGSERDNISEQDEEDIKVAEPKQFKVLVRLRPAKLKGYYN